MPSLISSVLILLLSSLFIHVNGGTKSYHAVSVDSLLPRETCSSFSIYSSTSGFNSTGLKVTHKQGPCSLLPLKTNIDHSQLLKEDEARVANLHHRASAATNFRANLAAPSIPATDGSSFSTGNYIVSLGFGTPTKHQSLVFDTGSDVTWIQCEPCVSSCYPQQEPIFDPTQSSTYTNISCSSSYCAQLDTSGCSGSTCLYAVLYGDNSQTVGFFAQDTLTLTPSNVLPGFHFGCGEKNSGTFGTAAGLLGLGRSPVSFVSQTTKAFSGVFSYCIPSTPSSTGYLSFGPSSSPPNAKLTPMLTDPNNPSFYFLNLVSITVAGRRLPIPSTVFSTAGTIIDSGTVISRLPPAAYSALRSAFRLGMKKYKSAPALSILDTCYDLTGVSSVTMPTVVFTFGGGATMNLDPSGILYVASVSQACLAFAGNGDGSDMGIYGNTQQRTFGVVYDVPNRVVGFGAGGCT